MVETTSRAARLKLAELASTIGALLIGFGAGGWLAPAFQGWAIHIGALGIVLHSIGMYDKHRVERAATERRIVWVESLYWLCWLALAVGALWLAFRS